MKSMTGYGRGEAVSRDGLRFNAEIHTYNKKQLDIRSRLPMESMALEPLVRELVAEKIQRGAVNLRINLVQDENNSTGSARIDRKLADSYLKQAEIIQHQHQMEKGLTLGELLLLPGVIELRQADINDENSAEAVSKAISHALKKLNEMRSAEGRKLKHDLQARIKKLSQLTDQISPLTAELPELQRRKLLERLNETELDLHKDDERILREMVIFCDRADVSEEITRLKSHFEQFQNFLDSRDAVGRSLEFLLQEIHREITTLGNKAASTDVSPLIVEFKAELEKIREQVQNIE